MRSGRVLLAEHIYDRLREAIIRGEIEPGERLTEARLADRLNVSRTPIREALRRLEAEGLLVRDGAGLATMKLDFRTASEVMLIRELLEPYCGETSAPNLTIVELTRLDSLVSEMRTMLESADGTSLVLADLNIAFHDALYSGCPYGRLLDEMRRNRDHFVTYWLYALYDRSDLERSVGEHAEIAKIARQVASGKVEASELGSELKAHIQRARAIFVKRAEEMQPAP
jgi:DNA-binding GntR family transcriptional regulator